MSLFPRTPRLPQELFLHIIDCLYDDRRTLSSCSLVSKSWTHQSRRHLLRNIEVHIPQSSGSHSEKTRLDRLASCLKELQVSTIHKIRRPFFSYIRELVIGFDLHFMLNIESMETALHRVDIVPLMDVLCHLPHLKKLSFSSMHFVASKPVLPLSSPVLSLERLILFDTIWDGLDENGCDAGPAFWSLFKSIDDIVFQSNQATDTGSYATKQAVFSPGRRNFIKAARFNIVKGCMGPGIDIIQQVIDLASVTQFIITLEFEPIDNVDFVKFINKCPNVEYIEVRLEVCYRYQSGQ